MAVRHNRDSRPDSQVTRRTLLAVGSVAFAASAAPFAAADTESEIVSLYHQYMAITDEAAVHPSLDDEELDRLFYDRRDVIEDRMMALPCRTPGDFAAKIIVASCRGEVFPDWDEGKIWIEARSLIGGAA